MARNKLKVNLKDGLREVWGMVEAVLTEVRKKQDRLYEELLQLYNKEHGKHLFELVTGYKKQYELTLKEDILHMFEKWRESDGSVCAFLKNSGSDDDHSMAEGRRFEGSIEEYLKKLISRELERPVEDMAEMSMSLDEVLEALLELYRRELKRLENLRMDVKKKVETCKEDNFIYVPVGVLLEALLHVNKQFYEDLCSTMTREVSELLLQQTTKAINSEEETIKTLATLIK